MQYNISVIIVSLLEILENLSLGLLSLYMKSVIGSVLKFLIIMELHRHATKSESIKKN